MEQFSAAWNQIYSDYLLHAETAVTTRRQPPPPSTPQFNIALKFSYNAVFSDWVVSPDFTRTHLLSVGELPSTGTAVVLIKLRQFCYHTRAQEIIAEELQHLPVHGEGVDKLIEFALRKAREAVVSMPSSNNVVSLHIHLTAFHHYVSPSIGRNKFPFIVPFVNGERER